MIPVGWLAPTGHWDANTLRLLFNDDLYPTGLEFGCCDGYPNPKRNTGAVLVIPGRYWVGQQQQINDAIHSYEWVLAVRISDEEDTFDPDQVEHPNLRWWIQTPRVGRDYGDAYLFGVGHTPHFNKLSPDLPEKDLDVCLIGQDTHGRRNECFDALEAVPGPQFVQRTDGFTKGLAPDRYAYQMMTTKVAPCPAGPATPDTFRVYEALEAHAVPIADDITPAYDSVGYWRMLFPDTPMPILTDYAQLPGYIHDALDGYPRVANRVTAWWIREKRRMARRLKSDLEALGAL